MTLIYQDKYIMAYLGNDESGQPSLLIRGISAKSDVADQLPLSVNVTLEVGNTRFTGRVTKV